jgi:hypothetical protein
MRRKLGGGSRRGYVRRHGWLKAESHAGGASMLPM